MLLNYSGTINARETRFVPESCWHVTASEFQSFRAASILLDRRLCSEANSTSLPMGFCAQKTSQVTTGQFDLKYLLNLNKFSTIG